MTEFFNYAMDIWNMFHRSPKQKAITDFSFMILYQTQQINYDSKEAHNIINSQNHSYYPSNLTKVGEKSPKNRKDF